MTRECAWRVLRSGSPAPTREVDRFARAAGLEGRDRALVRRLVATEVRRRGSLRAIVKAFTRKTPKPDLVVHLHLGLVQVLYLDRIPDHAALSETSDAVARTVGQSKVPFVNGVLRSVLRARQEGPSGDPRRDLVGSRWALDREVFRDPVKHPLLWAEDALSIPASLMKRWAKRYRADPAERLARGFAQEPPLVLRAWAERDAVLEELAALGIDARAGRGERTIVCRRGEADDAPDPTQAVTASPAFREGRVTIQGETAAAAAELAGAGPDERVLDLCAAPGGKSALLAAAGARVVAVDRDPRRLLRARETCARLGVGARVALVAADGTAGALAGTSFDAVLIDAPCSNTGVLGARPEARWRFGPRSLASLGRLQERLLAAGAARTRPGGRLVWSTCSLEPEENGRLVRRLLADDPDWELEEERDALPDFERGPFDGGYAARLRRREG